MVKPTVLVFTKRYLPGFKAGGIIRSLANLIEQIGDEFHFRVVTTDRDFGDSCAYTDVVRDGWTKVGKAEVMYLSPSDQGIGRIGQIMRKTQHDVVWTNSFFYPNLCIQPVLLRKMGAVPYKPLIVAPRGEFSAGALAIHNLRKRWYSGLARVGQCYKDALWHATAAQEAADIRRIMGRKAMTHIATNVSLPAAADRPHPPKRSGELKLLFLSRIDRKKNLGQALTFVSTLEGSVEFNIYGPVADDLYWRQCNAIMATMPSNVNARYCGIVEHQNVGDVMSEHHAFLFPTLGENFGHVIAEALCAGCPVVVSDRTPWNDLESRAVGWDISLDNPQRFMIVLRDLVDMDDLRWQRLSANAKQFGRSETQIGPAVSAHVEMFRSVLL